MARSRSAKKMLSDRIVDDASTVHVNHHEPFSQTIWIRDHKFIFIFISFFAAIAAIVFSYYFAGSHLGKGINRTPVFLRGLVKSDINYQEILAENENVSWNESSTHHTHPLLGYITPWNPKGYDLAKKFTSKFSHLSPVWYSITSGENLLLDGRHNVDVGWMSEIRANGHTKIVPRVVLEVPPSRFLTKKKWRERAVELIAAECMEMDYDGIVLESWSGWAAYGVLHDLNMRNTGLGFIRQVGNTLHSLHRRTAEQSRLCLVYVIGPASLQGRGPHDFGPEDIHALADAVDGFSLMTYDFSAPDRPGPNAPLEWIRASVGLLLRGTPLGGAHKMFLGVNFYGNDFTLNQGGGGGPITGREYVRVLAEEKPEEAVWDERSAEHVVFYTDGNGVDHAVFYPTLLSLSLRLDEARALRTGVAVWELGQGLDYFFGLL